MRSFILCTAILSAGFYGCGDDTRADREVELDYLRAVVPDSLLEFSHLEVASEDRVAIVGEGQDRYLGLQIAEEQAKVNGGERAELSVDYPFRPGDIVRYSWRFMLPADFVSDFPSNRWCLIAQWHDQPNVTLGESWDTFPSRSPPFMFGLGELDGKMGFVLIVGPTTNSQDQAAKGPVNLNRGVWHQIATVVHWSQGEDGKVQVFLDDSTTPALTATGPNMNNNFQHFLKLGMYRHPDIATNNWIYIDDLKISQEQLPD